MVEIIPSINVPTFLEVQERIAKVEPARLNSPRKTESVGLGSRRSYISWCHLDVTDGVFSKHITWHDPLDLPQLETKLNCEVHLMIEQPEKILDQWLVHPIKRIIAHLEAMRNPELIIKKCREASIEIGFAIKPDTFLALLKPWFAKIDLVLLLTVPPGASGQKMYDDTFERIKHVRDACASCRIEIDGQMNRETIPLAARAGADFFVVGHAIFSSQDIPQAIQELYHAANR
ncbi:MAG: ribulosephosphate 3-epimerase [Parcubacteria group bacterium Gr01-1014_66]|nr:MAG: ribulosephosphate 3-epimerase [Parcubacteria group bacterium Gr01-1014_66]